MKYILEKDLKYGNNFETGSFAEIYEGIFNDKAVCIKRYFDEYLPDFYEEKKLEYLTKLSKDVDKSIILPENIIKKNKKTIGYTSELIKNNTDFYHFFKKDLNEKDKIKYLLKTKEKLEIMHNSGIIHADIHEYNIIFDNKNNPYIIDFDNSTVGDYETNCHLSADLVEQFIYYNEISKLVDIYMFNILTYSVLNDTSKYGAIREISNNNYGIFTTKDEIDICKSISNIKPCNEYLIDAIKVKIKLK